jgi:hypothetical protein
MASVWGLGAEHEMLLVRDDGTRIDSEDIVDSIASQSARRAYEAVLGPGGADLVRTKKDGAVIGAKTALPKVAKKKGVKRKEVVDAFVSTAFPDLALNDYNAKIRLGLGWKAAEDIDFAGPRTRFAESVKGTVDKTSLGPMAAALLAGTPAAKTYEKELGDAVDAVLPTLARRPMVGDRLDYGTYGWSSRLMPTAPPGAAAATGAQIVRAALRSNIAFDAIKGNEIEVDSGFVEVKSTRFKNVTIDGVVAQLAALEERVLDAAGKGAEIFAFSGGQFGETFEYAGSYHVWFTLPHSPQGKNENGFEASHVAFASCLQWLEPLLLACCTSCDPRAIGAGTERPRAYMRGILNWLSGVGTTDVCGAMRSRKAPPGPVVHFASREDFEAFVASGGEKKERRKRALTMAGRVEGTKTCVDIDRQDRGGIHFSDEDVVRTSGIDAALELRHDAKFTLNQGNDIRVPYCFARQEHRLPHGWTAHVVKEAGGKLVVRYAHLKNRKWSADPPQDTKGMRTGFEFRLMDNMPRAALRPLLELFVLVAAASSKHGGCVNPSGDPDWTHQVADGVVMGHHAPAIPAYVDKLRRTLSLPPTPKGGNGAGGKKKYAETAWTALVSVQSDLRAAYGDHPWVKLMAPPNPKMTDLVNVNAAGWDYAFQMRVREGPALLASLKTDPEKWAHDLPFLADYAVKKALTP